MHTYLSHLDSSIIYAIQSIGPSFAPAARFICDVVLSTHWLAPAVIVALLLIGKRRVALEIFFIFVVATGVILGLKGFIAAPRPYWIDPAVVHYATETDYGMPSGHALISMVILGWLWWRHPRSKILSIVIPFCILIVGVARIYLGVHYPSQVLAGWILGALLLWFFLWIDRWYFRPRQ